MIPSSDHLGVTPTQVGVMPRIPHDRTLLFGILAVQMNLISRDALIEATHEWMKDSRRSLGEILMTRKALGEKDCTLLDGALARQVELQGGDVERSLADFFSI